MPPYEFLTEVFLGIPPQDAFLTGVVVGVVLVFLPGAILAYRKLALIILGIIKNIELFPKSSDGDTEESRKNGSERIVGGMVKK